MTLITRVIHVEGKKKKKKCMTVYKTYPYSD